MKKFRLAHVGLVLALFIVGCSGNSLVKERPTDRRALVHAQLGASYMQRNQYKVALKELNLALDIDSSHPVANYVMGVLQARLGDDKRADAYFRRAISEKPEYAEAQQEYGEFLCKRGKYKEAFEHFKMALTNPLYRTPELVNLKAGECILSQARPDIGAAERYFRTALAFNPRLHPALEHMARISYQRRKYLSARAYVQRYFEIGPDTPAALYWGVRTERELGATEAADRYLRRLRARFPSSKEARQLSQRSYR
ncbi:MAG TPA: type IV pilus biogenesis/stability protein PilW [Acidiferrobacteraceae bacterium]|nr:type IV pilus biogenesis/stability protein PilW [Acidiferrobacteraceae bacterium]